MKRKQVWRYYCEHCKKSGCSSSHMGKHEKHCCRNPQRQCRMCGTQGRDYQALGKVFLLGKALCDQDLETLSGAVDGCPACILATIFQANLCGDGQSPLWGWDYKKAVQEWWDEKNAQAMDAEHQLNCGMVSNYGSL